MEKSGHGKYRYRKVYEALKEQIETDAFRRGDYLPPEGEIGRLYDVDRSTVRRALKLLVNDGIVEKHAGVGTRVISSSVQAAKAPAGKSIAFLLAKSPASCERITHPFYASLFYHIEKSCKQKDCSLVYSTLSEEDRFDQTVAGVSGIIFVNSIGKKHLDRALELKIPCVLVNSRHAGIPSVMADSFAGTYLTCRHLIGLGHRRIAVASGAPGYVTNTERMRGCLIALLEAGLSLPGNYLAETDWEFDSGYRLVRRMLQTAQPRPTALVCFNDTIALGAIQAALELGLSVPEDLSITGFDNMDQAQYTMPRLTTVDDHVKTISDVTLQSLFGQMEGRETYPVKITTPVELVVRGTTCAPKQTS